MLQEIPYWDFAESLLNASTHHKKFPSDDHHFHKRLLLVAFSFQENPLIVCVRHASQLPVTRNRTHHFIHAHSTREAFRVPEQVGIVARDQATVV